MTEQEKIIVNFDELDIYVLNGNRMNNPKNLYDIYQKSFKCWHNVWEKFHTQEYNHASKLFSDEFTRQDDILALFYKGECFGITFFRNVKWDDVTSSLDSYFNVWPEIALKKLTDRGENISVCSQFTIAENFRQKNIDIPWKDILFSMIMRKFLDDENNAMTGTMRVKKGMEKISYNAGGVPILKGLVYQADGNETVDLIAFFKEEVGEKYRSHPYYPKLEACWNRSTHYNNSTKKKVA